MGLTGLSHHLNIPGTPDEAQTESNLQIQQFGQAGASKDMGQTELSDIPGTPNETQVTLTSETQLLGQVRALLDMGQTELSNHSSVPITSYEARVESSLQKQLLGKNRVSIDMWQTELSHYLGKSGTSYEAQVESIQQLGQPGALKTMGHTELPYRSGERRSSNEEQVASSLQTQQLGKAGASKDMGQTELRYHSGISEASNETQVESSLQMQNLRPVGASRDMGQTELSNEAHSLQLQQFGHDISSTFTWYTGQPPLDLGQVGTSDKHVQTEDSSDLQPTSSNLKMTSQNLGIEDEFRLRHAKTLQNLKPGTIRDPKFTMWVLRQALKIIKQHSEVIESDYARAMAQRQPSTSLNTENPEVSTNLTQVSQNMRQTDLIYDISGESTVKDLEKPVTASWDIGQPGTSSDVGQIGVLLDFEQPEIPQDVLQGQVGFSHHPNLKLREAGALERKNRWKVEKQEDVSEQRDVIESDTEITQDVKLSCELDAGTSKNGKELKVIGLLDNSEESENIEDNDVEETTYRNLRETHDVSNPYNIELGQQYMESSGNVQETQNIELIQAFVPISVVWNEEGQMGIWIIEEQRDIEETDDAQEAQNLKRIQDLDIAESGISQDQRKYWNMGELKEIYEPNDILRVQNIEALRTLDIAEAGIIQDHGEHWDIGNSQDEETPDDVLLAQNIQALQALDLAEAGNLQFQMGLWNMGPVQVIQQAGFLQEVGQASSLQDEPPSQDVIELWEMIRSNENTEDVGWYEEVEDVGLEMGAERTSVGIGQSWRKCNVSDMIERSDVILDTDEINETWDMRSSRGEPREMDETDSAYTNTSGTETTVANVDNPDKEQSWVLNETRDGLGLEEEVERKSEFLPLEVTQEISHPNRLSFQQIEQRPREVLLFGAAQAQEMYPTENFEAWQQLASNVGEISSEDQASSSGNVKEEPHDITGDTPYDVKEYTIPEKKEYFVKEVTVIEYPQEDFVFGQGTNERKTNSKGQTRILKNVRRAVILEVTREMLPTDNFEYLLESDDILVCDTEIDETSQNATQGFLVEETQVMLEAENFDIDTSKMEPATVDRSVQVELEDFGSEELQEILEDSQELNTDIKLSGQLLEINEDLVSAELEEISNAENLEDLQQSDMNTKQSRLLQEGWYVQVDLSEEECGEKFPEDTGHYLNGAKFSYRGETGDDLKNFNQPEVYCLLGKVEDEYREFDMRHAEICAQLDIINLSDVKVTDEILREVDKPETSADIRFVETLENLQYDKGRSNKTTLYSQAETIREIYKKKKSKIEELDDSQGKREVSWNRYQSTTSSSTEESSTSEDSDSFEVSQNLELIFEVHDIIEEISRNTGVAKARYTEADQDEEELSNDESILHDEDQPGTSGVAFVNVQSLTEDEENVDIEANISRGLPDSDSVQHCIEESLDEEELEERQEIRIMRVGRSRIPEHFMVMYDIELTMASDVSESLDVDDRETLEPENVDDMLSVVVTDSYSCWLAPGFKYDVQNNGEVPLSPECLSNEQF